MNRSLRNWLRCLSATCTLVAAIAAGAGRADFFLFKGDADGSERSLRYSEQNSSLNRSYGLHWFDETVWENATSHFLSPDRTTLYFLMNSVGRSGTTAFDVASGVRVQSVGFAFNQMATGPSSVFLGSAPLFNPTSLTFLIAGRSNHNSAESIKTFSSVTGQFLSSADLPTTVNNVSDLALGTNGSVFAATNLGVFRSPFSSLATPLIVGVTGDMAVGPDGLLYLSEPAAGKVNRYNPSTGALVDAFITAADLGNTRIGAIEFAPGGVLYVQTYNATLTGVRASKVSKVDVATRTELASYPVDLFSTGPLLVLPIPEPASNALAAWILTLCGMRPRRRTS